MPIDIKGDVVERNNDCPTQFH